MNLFTLWFVENLFVEKNEFRFFLQSFSTNVENLLKNESENSREKSFFELCHLLWEKREIFTFSCWEFFIDRIVLNFVRSANKSKINEENLTNLLENYHGPLRDTLMFK